MPSILFVLQNGYTSKKYGYANKQEWSADIKKSHSGRRLLKMIPDNVDYYLINSTDEIANNAKEILPAKPKYILGWISKLNPDIICACGKIAQQGCADAGIEFIAIPHPSWRRLTGEMIMRIKQNIESRLRLRQQ